MEEHRIMCDACGFDLTSTSNAGDYRLALCNQSIAPSSNPVSLMGFYPAIERDAHFCGVDCLRWWLNKNYPVSERRYTRGKLGSKGPPKP
jgi:hypothetical protein